MASELHQLRFDPPQSNASDESSAQDDRPLLNPDSDAVADDDSDDLHQKYAPFVRRDVYGTMGRGELPWMEKVLLAIALVTIVPIRVVIGTSLLFLYYMICRVCTLFHDPNRETDEQEDYAHMVGWRRSVIVCTGRFLSRAMLFVLGFYWISEVYRILPNEDKSTNEVRFNFCYLFQVEIRSLFCSAFLYISVHSYLKLCIFEIVLVLTVICSFLLFDV